jgi:hypothetical protein
MKKNVLMSFRDVLEGFTTEYIRTVSPSALGKATIAVRNILLDI